MTPLAGTNTGMVPLAYDKVAMYYELYDTLKEEDEDRVSVAKGFDSDRRRRYNALHMDDGDARAPSGDLDLSDDVLCAVAKIAKTMWARVNLPSPTRLSTAA